MTLFIVGLVLIMVLPIAAIRFYFASQNSEKVAAKYINDEEGKSVLVKKYDEANPHFYRTVFLLVGLAMSLGILHLAFDFTPKDDDSSSTLVAFVDEEDVEDIPQTNQTKPPPPPPPPPPEVIEVEDDEEIEEEPEIFEQEFDDEEEIEPPVIEEPVVEEEPEPEEPEIFLVVEDMPKFPGGEKEMYGFLYKNIKYPQIAKENGIEGKVYVQFVVNEAGKVINAVVKRGIGGGCDEEALKAVERMPSWKPGKQRGKPVRVQFTIPIHFTLE